MNKPKKLTKLQKLLKNILAQIPKNVTAINGKNLREWVKARLWNLNK